MLRTVTGYGCCSPAFHACIDRQALLAQPRELSHHMCVIMLASFFLRTNFPYSRISGNTVKLVYKDRPWDQRKVVFMHRWSLYTGYMLGTCYFYIIKCSQSTLPLAAIPCVLNISLITSVKEVMFLLRLVCLSVCVSVIKITQKVTDQFLRKF